MVKYTAEYCIRNVGKLAIKCKDVDDFTDTANLFLQLTGFTYGSEKEVSRDRISNTFLGGDCFNPDTLERVLHCSEEWYLRNGYEVITSEQFRIDNQPE